MERVGLKKTPPVPYLLNRYLLIQNLQYYWALKDDEEETSRIQIVQLVSYLTRSVQQWHIRSVSHLCRCKRHAFDADILIVHLYYWYIRSSCLIRMLKSPKGTVLHKEYCGTGPYILRCIHMSASWTNIFHTSLSFRKIKRKKQVRLIRTPTAGVVQWTASKDYVLQAG